MHFLFTNVLIEDNCIKGLKRREKLVWTFKADSCGGDSDYMELFIL